MALKQLLRPTNRKVRLLVGLLLAILFGIQCTQSEAFKESEFVRVIDGQTYGTQSPEAVANIEDLARTDHIALLEHCRKNYRGRYLDYTCTFLKQERVGGQLGKEQAIAVKFMDTPFSVAMAWTANPPMGDRVLYVKGRNGDKMVVRPRVGWMRAVTGGSVLREPAGADAMRYTLRPVNAFGLDQALERLLNVYRAADRRGDLREEFGGYAEVAGRKTIVLVRFLPAKHDYPSQKTVVYIDTEYLVPVCVEGYDWDEQFTCRYLYKDVKFNVGLAADDFLPAANDIEGRS